MDEAGEGVACCGPWLSTAVRVPLQYSAASGGDHMSVTQGWEPGAQNPETAASCVFSRCVPPFSTCCVCCVYW